MTRRRGDPELDRINEDIKARHRALSARLGFDTRIGGRRFGELSINPYNTTHVFLSITETIVTDAQARAIRNILTTGNAEGRQTNEEL